MQLLQCLCLGFSAILKTFSLGKNITLIQETGLILAESIVLKNARSAVLKNLFLKRNGLYLDLQKVCCCCPEAKGHVYVQGEVFYNCADQCCQNLIPLKFLLCPIFSGKHIFVMLFFPFAGSSLHIGQRVIHPAQIPFIIKA